MEQRSLRLGDLVDDYCPRERRVTNHVIVVLDGNAVRQTRCNTCDAEHEYKEAKLPRRKGKNGESDLAGGTLVQPKPAAVNGVAPEVPDVPVEAADSQPELPAPVPVAATAPAPVTESKADDPLPADGWLAHRPLIRASLPRTEGEPPPQPRTIPEFTMHQRHGRGFGGGRHGGGFRHGNPGHNGGRMPPARDGNGEPDGNRSPAPGGGGGGGGKSRHRRRRRR